MGAKVTNDAIRKMICSFLRFENILYQHQTKNNVIPSIYIENRKDLSYYFTNIVFCLCNILEKLRARIYRFNKIVSKGQVRKWAKGFSYGFYCLYNAIMLRRFTARKY